MLSPARMIACASSWCWCNYQATARAGVITSSIARTVSQAGTWKLFSRYMSRVLMLVLLGWKICAPCISYEDERRNPPRR